jgi:hypothetical protein
MIWTACATADRALTAGATINPIIPRRQQGEQDESFAVWIS